MAPGVIPRWLEATGSFVFCDSQLLTVSDSLEPAVASEAVPALLAAGREVLDDFAERPHGYRVVELTDAASALPAGMAWLGVRRLIAAESPLAPAACRALGLLNWRRTSRYCGVCGTGTEEHPVEMARRCPACGQVVYPCIPPAIIVRVERDGRMLLARHVGHALGFHTCLAGYVEAGETAEEAVRREIREEVGVEVDSVRYVGSQYWPYPGQLMLAYSARWVSGDIRLQPEELSAADWFERSQLPEIPPPGSVAHRLIHDWRFS